MGCLPSVMRAHVENGITVRGTVAYRQEAMLNDATRIGVGFRVVALLQKKAGQR